MWTLVVSRCTTIMREGFDKTQVHPCARFAMNEFERKGERVSHHEGSCEVEDSINDKSNLGALNGRVDVGASLCHECSSIGQYQVCKQTLPPLCNWAVLQAGSPSSEQAARKRRQEG